MGWFNDYSVKEVEISISKYWTSLKIRDEDIVSSHMKV